ncbi:Uncharacterised protein [Raoultella terrigena]|uniref:Uncharacterized protein n=1 Tax=Raoultella terrigena TaxID=577 RepID=A0A3P8KYT3_RAOTE|nr:Uncharacterised protein [Raoultella terrigena]
MRILHATPGELFHFDTPPSGVEGIIDHYFWTFYPNFLMAHDITEPRLDPLDFLDFQDPLDFQNL